MKIIENKSHEIHELLRRAYWAKDRSELTTQKAIGNSLNYAIIEVTSDQPVGFARVVTDYSTVYYLCDVYVDERFRGRGLGKKWWSGFIFLDLGNVEDCIASIHGILMALNNIAGIRTVILNEGMDFDI